MSYLTVYLHADTEQALHDALAAVLPLEEDDTVITASHDHCLVWLPELRRPTGVVDDEGVEITEPVPGCHANLRTRHQSVVDYLTAAGVVINPESPSVVFA